MKLVYRMVVVVVVALMIGLLPVSAQTGEQPLNLLLTFIPNIQFSPVYAAIGAGYFAESGYDATIEYLNEPDVVDLVASGEASFGIVSGEQAILAASQMRPIVFVYEWFQQYPIGIAYSAAREIETAADLEGLRVGIPGRFGASYSGLTTLLADAGLAESAIDLQEIGFNAPDVFCVGAVDAAVVYANNEPLQMQMRADAGECGDVSEVNVLLVSDVVDLVSNGIITSQQLLNDDPESVSLVLAAFDRGLRLVIDNPAEGYLLSAPFVEGLPLTDEFRAALEELSAAQQEFLAAAPDREAVASSRAQMLADLKGRFSEENTVQFEILLNTIEMWDADRIGYSDLISWENMQETLQLLGQLTEPVDLATLFSNDYLPGNE
jgi:NitT/TauT family transport system substrate-binding protein